MLVAKSTAIWRELKASGERGAKKEGLTSSLYIFFSFLPGLSEVKYHWPKSGKGERTVNLFMFDEG